MSGIGGTALPGDVPTFNVFRMPFESLAWGADFASASSGAGLFIDVGPDVFSLGSLLGMPGDGFVGFISSVPFESVTLRVETMPTEFGEGYGIDEVSYAIPSPSSVVCVGGLWLVACRRRRGACVSR